MSFPSNIYLASSAKYFGFVDPKSGYNDNWDITWSFTFALTGAQHGFCTFLTTSPSPLSSIPGQYLGYLDDLTPITPESPTAIGGVLAIAFDSTGYFALSDVNNFGISTTNCKPNSLVIRHGKSLIFNEHLSSLDTSFFLSSSTKSYQTLRFRLANTDKLYIDYKPTSGKYKNLATVNISAFRVNNELLYPAFSYSSPISSISIDPSTLWIKNFHTQGCKNEPTYEIEDYIPLLPDGGTIYTSISGISATPI